MLARARSSVLEASRHVAARLSEALARWSRAQEGVPDTVADAAETAAEQLSGTGDGQRTAAQTVTTIISLLLIAGLAGIILLEGFAGREDAPVELQVEVQMEASEQRGEHFHIPIVVHNLGSEAVEEVLVTIDVLNGEQVIEETETVIALIGEDEEAEAVLVLDRDPSGLTIEARVLTFQTSGS